MDASRLVHVSGLMDRPRGALSGLMDMSRLMHGPCSAFSRLMDVSRSMHRSWGTGLPRLMDVPRLMDCRKSRR